MPLSVVTRRLDLRGPFDSVGLEAAVFFRGIFIYTKSSILQHFHFAVILEQIQWYGMRNTAKG
jgi:hypothetical protein